MQFSVTKPSLLALLPLAAVFSLTAQAADSGGCGKYQNRKVCAGDVITLGDKDDDYHRDVVIDTASPSGAITYHNVSMPKMKPVPGNLRSIIIVTKPLSLRGVAVGQHFTLRENGDYNIVVTAIYSDGTFDYRTLDADENAEQTERLDNFHPVDYNICPRSKPNGCTDQLGFPDELRPKHGKPAGAVDGDAGLKDVHPEMDEDQPQPSHRKGDGQDKI